MEKVLPDPGAEQRLVAIARTDGLNELPNRSIGALRGVVAFFCTHNVRQGLSYGQAQDDARKYGGYFP